MSCEKEIQRSLVDGLFTNSTNRFSLVWSYGNTPVNLTGYTFRMDLKRDLAASTVPALQITTTLTNGNQITTNPTAGEIIVEIGEASSASLTGIYYTDLRVIEPSGKELTIAPLTLKFHPSVTV